MEPYPLNSNSPRPPSPRVPFSCSPQAPIQQNITFLNHQMTSSFRRNFQFIEISVQRGGGGGKNLAYTEAEPFWNGTGNQTWKSTHLKLWVTSASVSNKCEWQVQCEWQVWMTSVSDRCEWQVSVKSVSDKCEWQVSVKSVSDKCERQVWVTISVMTSAGDRCEWKVCVTSVRGKCEGSVNDKCEWQVWVRSLRDKTCEWQVRGRSVSDRCEWQVRVKSVSDT